MSVRDWLSLSLAALVLLGGMGYCREYRAHVKAEAQAEAIQVRLDSLKVRIAARTDSIARQDSLASERRAERERRVREAEDDAERARSRADSLAVLVRDQLPDDALPAFDSLEAAHAQEVGALRLVIRTKDQWIGELQDRLAQRDRLNADLREALAKTEDQRDLWERRARPGFFAEIGGDLPKLIGAAAVGAVVATVVK